MSLHFTLAKKVLAHAKDLLKHIFNEAGQDVKAMEQKFLQALKSHAEDELSKAEDAAKNAVSGELQHWQKAPRPEDATSVHAPADLSWEESDDKEKEAEEEPAVPTATPSATESEKGEDDKKSDESADGEKGKDAPAAGVQTYPAGDTPVHGDAEQPKFDAPARTPVVSTSDLPTEGAASVHGDALPSSGLQSQALADSGKGGGAGSELDLAPAPTPSDAQSPSASESAKGDGEKEAPTPPPSAPTATDAPLGGQDATVAETAKTEQESVPALNGGLDAQKDEGKPAEPEADKEVAEDKKLN